MKKQYIFILLFVTHLIMGQTPTGNSAEVGITEGQLSVSLSGAATYSIPISVPPGINGVVPQVGLVYNSQGGNGMAGYGWNISGVSAITRIPRTKFHDGVVAGVNIDANDRFALDGQRLILKTGTAYGASGSTYETENFSNLKITFYKDIIQIGNGLNFQFTDYFVLEHPDGSIAQYGLAPDSRSITTWSINYWENPQGVRISYTYNLSNNNLTIKAIKYGTVGTTTAINSIDFVYNTRKRLEQSYVAGESVYMNTILSEIKVKGNGLGFRNYILGQEETTLGYERLKSITEKSGDGTKSFNPTVFSYEDTSDTIPSVNWASLENLSGMSTPNIKTVSGDFFGDEKMDYLIYNIYMVGEYWLASDIQMTTPNTALLHKVGAFEDIFAFRGLNQNNKLERKQGWAVVKKTDTNYTFSIIARKQGLIENQYERVVNFPIHTQYFSCTNSNVSKIFSKKIISGDFNGDGLTDVIAIDTDVKLSVSGRGCSESVTLSSKKVYFVDLKRDLTTDFVTYSGELASIITSKTKVEVADVNGDGKSDFMVFENGKVTTYTLNGSNQLVLLWNYLDTNISIEYGKTILLGDYNGDCKTDFLIPTGFNSAEWSKYSSTGINFIKEIQTYPGLVYLENTSDKNYDYIASEYDKDGKTDIIRTRSYFIWAVRDPYNGVPEKATSIQLWCFKNREGKFTEMNATSQITPPSYNITFPVRPIYLPSSNGIMIKDKPVNPTLDIAFLSNNRVYYFTCLKDNAKEQLIRAVTTGNGARESITYQSLSNASKDDMNRSIYSPSTVIANYPQSDIELATAWQVVTKLEKQSASVYKKQLFSYAGATTNLEGLGFLGFRASMCTNWFDDNSTEPSTSQIISSISKFDPNLRGANIENYTYLGFVEPATTANATTVNIPRTSKIIVNNTRTTTQTLQATNSIRFLPGATISPTGTNSFKAQITPDYDANGFAETNTTPPSNLISKSLSFYETSISPTKVFTIKNTQSNNYNILDNTGNETVNDYDDFSNPIESISKIRNAGVGEQITITTIVYKTPLTTPYLIGRPDSKIQTVSTFGDTMTSKEVYGYGTGTESNLLKKIEKWGNNTNVITEDNIYDAFGNITKKTITANGITPRVTNYEYNPALPYNGRFLTKSTDIEGLSTVFNYNTSNGNLVSETNPYNLTTTYLFNDAWFKKTKTIDYLGKSNTYAYSRINSVNTLVTTTGDDGSYSEEVFDDLGRKITSGIRDISGNTSKVSYLYDINDRNIKVSEPYFGAGATQWNETKYDQYGRTSQNISFTGKTVLVSYSGLSTTVNDGTKTKKSVKNAIGNVVSMTDTPGGIINYIYFANGNLKTSNYGGVVTTIEQDGWGRKTKLTDPSAGEYRYTYNEFSETTSEITPNGTTTYTLNDVGKLIAKTISGTNTNSSTVYNYNSSTKLLDSSIFTNTLEAGAVTTNTFSYDNYKRLVGIIEATPYATFSKTVNIFDAFGRVETETSVATANGKTSSKTIKNTYKNSYAWQILDNVSQQVLWQTNTVNARGQLLTANMGNGTAITNGYDTYGFPAQIKHDKTGASPSNIMTLIITFDEKKGNLKSLTNSMFGWSEDFTNSYDSLDRLTSYKNAQGEVETQTYSEDGRIDVNTLGKYNYANTAKKYQNTSITLTTDALTYYKNRGVVTLPSPTATRALNITYNTFKSPVEIKEDGVDNLSFVYNDNNDRSTMFYGSTNPDKSLRPNRKYYSADGSMEIKQNILTGATEFFTYIGGDGYSAPIVLKSDGTTQNYLYLHRDYQGSILAITDANASVLEKRLFDAWGAILKVQNGAGVDLNVLTVLDRGYTGHEHLQSVGLINMNGRIYDPKLHRFLQPDNYVQDPYNTQNFNRYGYCWNNPLKYSDPNGEWIHLVIGAVVGGVFNWASNGFQFNAAGLGYLGTGALAGFTTALTGNPYFGAAIMGAGNSVTTQLATGGKIDVGQVIQGVGMSVAIAGVGAGIGNAIGPYMDKAVGSIITNSILKESLTQALTNSFGGFVIGAGVAGASGASFNDAISSGWSSAKMGFAMGATSGAIKGYIDVKAKTVASKDNATQTQTKPTTQENTAVAKYHPENGGAMGKPTTEMTTTGQVMDRYGDKTGSYASPVDTPFEMRSLPNSTDLSIKIKFEVLKPFPVQKSFVAPAHYNPGGGIQYQLPVSPFYLEMHGFIKFH